MDAQPKPGSESYLDDLERLLEKVQCKVLALGSLDGERVDTQVKQCAASMRMWDIRSLIAQERNDHEEARRCSKLSLEFNTQKTRAHKYLIADKLNDLESAVKKQGTSSRKLRRVK